MRTEAKEIIEKLYNQYGSGRTIKINDLLVSHNLTPMDTKAMLVGLEALGYIANNSGASRLCNMDDKRGHANTLDDVEIWAMLTEDGYKFHESELAKREKTTNNIMQIVKDALLIMLSIATLTLAIYKVVSDKNNNTKVDTDNTMAATPNATANCKDFRHDSLPITKPDSGTTTKPPLPTN